MTPAPIDQRRSRKRWRDQTLCVKVFHHERNLKLGGALRTGWLFEVARVLVRLDHVARIIVNRAEVDLPIDVRLEGGMALKDRAHC